MKTEIWNNHEIRFVEKDGEWWAVAADVCSALGLKQVTRALSSLKGVTKSKTLTNGGEQELNIIDEKNIYRLVFKSHKPEAEEFQDWVFDVLKTLRQSSGLIGWHLMMTGGLCFRCLIRASTLYARFLRSFMTISTSRISTPIRRIIFTTNAGMC